MTDSTSLITVPVMQLGKDEIGEHRISFPSNLKKLERDSTPARQGRKTNGATEGDYGGGAPARKTGVAASHYLGLDLSASSAADTSKHKASLNNTARLVNVQTGGTENGTRRRVGSMNNGEVSAKEKRIFAIGWGDGECERAATRTIQQVDGVRV